MRNGTSSTSHAMATVLLLGLFAGAACAQDAVEVVSPDGTIKVGIRIAELSGVYPKGKRLYYNITYGGQNLLLDSPLAFEIEGVGELSGGLAITKTDRRAVDQTWQRVWGKSKIVRDHCNELRVTLVTETEPQRTFDVVWRAYDDGVAFRYFLPSQPGIESFRLTAERSWFRFADNHTIWAANCERFESPQETEFFQRRLSNITAGSVYGLPLLVKADDKAWVAIAEANLTDWAGTYVTGLSGVADTVRTRLAPHIDNVKVCVTSQTPRYSPWRVLMIASEPGKLIESNLIDNLSEPCALTDTSWIKPGKCAWDWWWPGRYAPDVDFKLGPNNETMKYFIDFAAEMGWPYQLVDWQWYGPPFDTDVGGAPHPTSDITSSISGIDIPTLVQYARRKGVRLFVWLHWAHANEQMNEAFPLYEKWGVAGVKIDFMNRDDQEMVNYYHRVVKKAAEHHLLVDFHGAYKPTGESRTYPNFVTREGVLGNEYNKWSQRVTPDHCLTIPFTRMLTGPMDFTPGGFRHSTKDSFKVVGGDAPAPMVFGTRAFQLAMMVVYESPLQVLCDTPYEYRNSPAGLDFLKLVPTTWDETRVLHGQVGDFIAIARRSGDEWYVGTMTDWTGRSLHIPLTFLGDGDYRATIWADAPSAENHPAALARTVRSVTRDNTLTAKMAPGGGHVVHLKPAL